MFDQSKSECVNSIKQSQGRSRRTSLLDSLSPVNDQPISFGITKRRLMANSLVGVGWSELLGGGVPWPATMSSHLVAKLHHAALIGFDLRQMEGDVCIELLEERYPIANQDRQD